ncbi:GntR family transcriptional regulator [Carnobacterium pleistocenium]|uniref:GntR family transcriptional regulator n=1 Tax=Carnobacterium pleistocenium TaxID=181073 RepID=UPI00054EE424|nr:GntR family transcriptional regulator [Carnobacterium pleistocenium]
MSKPKKLEAKVYQHSKNQILTRQWLPQTHITEIGLAKELGISRTPIRQAFLRLEKEGYIVIEPNKGIRIQEKQISLQEFHEQLDFMELVLIDHLHFLQIKEIQFDTDALENTVDQINRVADEKDLDIFLTIEFDYMRGLFRYAKNSYATSLFLDTFRSIKEQNNEEIKDYLQLIQSTKVKHFNQIVLFLKNNDYPLARKEVRILVNQLSLIAIQGI